MFDTSRQIVVMKPDATMSLENRIELVRRAVRECSEHSCNRILFDMRNAVYAMNFMEDHSFHKHLFTKTGITPHHRVAVILEYDSDTAQDYGRKYTEGRASIAKMVAENWGTKVFELFDSYEDGLAWLESKASADVPGT